jgi:hypothetical protein
MNGDQAEGAMAELHESAAHAARGDEAVRLAGVQRGDFRQVGQEIRHAIRENWRDGLSSSEQLHEAPTGRSSDYEGKKIPENSRK